MSQQGYRCSLCYKFAHASCIADHQTQMPACLLLDTLHISDISVNPEILNRSFHSHFANIPKDVTAVTYLSNFELVVLCHLLRTQIWMLESGITLGTVIVDSASESLHFAVHELLHRYSATLKKSRNALPDAIDAYCQSTELPCSSSLLADNVFLDYSAARIQAGGLHTSARVSTSLALSTVMSRLDQEFGIKTKFVSEYFLTLLQETGRLETIDGGPLSVSTECELIVSLPVMLVPGPHRLLILQAISACLSTPSVTVQEAGLLLLSRYCQPNRLASPQNLQHGLDLLIRWLLNDGSLLVSSSTTRTLFDTERGHSASFSLLARIDKQRAVQDGSKAQPLRPQLDTNIAESPAKHQQLLIAYAPRWMAAFHVLHPSDYANLIYEASARLASENQGKSKYNTGHDEEKNIAYVDRLFGSFLKLLALGFLYSDFNTILARCLDEATIIWDKLFTSARDAPHFDFLTKLFAEEEHSFTDQAPRVSRSTVSIVPGEVQTPEPWSVIYASAEDGPQGFERSIMWLRMLAISGYAFPCIQRHS